MKSFKHITISVITSLVIIFAVQLFWLRALYNTISEEARREIRNSIEEADQLNLMYRVDSISNSKEEGDHTHWVSISQSLSVDSDKRKISKGTGEISNTDTLLVDSSRQKRYDNLFKELTIEVRLALHEIIDSIAPTNMHRLESITDSIIKKKGVDAHVTYSLLKDAKTHQVINSSKNGMSLPKQGEMFEYWYHANAQDYYHIYISPWTKTVLLQMAGLLITTFLIFVILCFAFWYLIHTILKQKTLEEMKDDFTNNMTHELKTPVAVAYSATDALLHFHQDDNPRKREQYLMICKEQLMKLSGLIEQILSMSVQNQNSFMLNKEDILLEDLINKLVEQHKLKMDKDVLFFVDVYPSNLIVHADKAHLGNVISNLIDNGVKYSAKRATIDIRVYKKDGKTVIEVQDNGIGISVDNQKYLFDKFYRVPSGNIHTVKGYGLGLFYVKTIVEKHNGSIELKSDINKGSIFTIQLP